MTLETMKSVVDELGRRGIPATFEYPGFIACTCANKLTIAAGDSQDYFGCDLMNADWECISTTVSSEVLSNSADVAAIADFIQEAYETEPWK